MQLSHIILKSNVIYLKNTTTALLLHYINLMALFQDNLGKPTSAR